MKRDIHMIATNANDNRRYQKIETILHSNVYINNTALIDKDSNESSVKDYLQYYDRYNSYQNYFFCYAEFTQGSTIAYNDHCAFIRVVPQRTYLDEISISLNKKDLINLIIDEKKKDLIDNLLKQYESYNNYYIEQAKKDLDKREKELLELVDIITNNNTLTNYELVQLSKKELFTEILKHIIRPKNFLFYNLIDYVITHITYSKSRDIFTVELAVTYTEKISNETYKQKALKTKDFLELINNNKKRFEWLLAQYICYRNNFQIPNNKKEFIKVLKATKKYQIKKDLELYVSVDTYKDAVFTYKDHLSFVAGGFKGELVTSENYDIFSIEFTKELANLIHINEFDKFTTDFNNYIENVYNLFTDDGKHNEGLSSQEFNYTDKEKELIKEGQFFVNLSEYFYDEQPCKEYFNLRLLVDEQGEQNIAAYESVQFYNRYFIKHNRFYLLTPKISENTYDKLVSDSALLYSSFV